VAHYVGKRLVSFGVTSGKVVVAKDVQAMVEKIRQGEVDVVLQSAFPTIELREKTGLIPKLLVWRKGSSEYSSVFFVRQDSAIQNLSDLKGKTIVFEDPQSTSAYLLPKAELKGNGLVVLPAEGQTGNAEAVRYVFAREEKNQTFFVLKKRADAGAYSSDDWKEMPAGQKKELRLIHETRPVLRFLASFHPELPAELSHAIAAILTQMASDPEGGQILRGRAGLEQMEELTDGHYRSLEYVQGLVNSLEN
jgi:phosphonate transport system substrate-binding protein